MTSTAVGTWRQAGVDFSNWARANHLAQVAAGWLLLLAVVAGLQRPDLTFAAARATYLLVALYGLRLLAGDTAQPSLGHAAFLALGAYGTAFLRLRAGIDGLTAAALLAALAAALGWLMGRGVTHLRPAFLALLTWTFGWAVYIALGAFPEVTGGVAGIPLRDPLRVRWDALGVDLTFNDAGHLALATGLLALLLLVYRGAQTSVIGRGWAALRDSRTLAASLGYDVAAARRAAFAVSAGLAALAGALGANLLKVVDPTSYSPLQSLNLLAAVLIGGPLGFFGPVAGALVTSGAPYLVDQASSIAGLPLGPGRELAAAALTIAALVVTLRLVRRPGSEVPGARRSAAVLGAAPGRATRPLPDRAVVLVATDLLVDFEGVRALDGASISLEAGTIHGLVGPNGSGKSTLLRCLAGGVGYRGAVALEGRGLDGLAEFRRVRSGVARTFQRTAIMPNLQAGEHVQVGLRVRSRHADWAQALFRTPAHRAEAAEGRERAVEILELFGLGDSVHALPGSLSAGRQRLLQIATAFATGPRALLLDEPAAGMDMGELDLLRRALRDIAAQGTAVLLIEHNMAFLARVAERVTVLDEGRVLVHGTPAEVAANPEVRRAYLGSGINGAPTPAPRTGPPAHPAPA